MEIKDIHAALLQAGLDETTAEVLQSLVRPSIRVISKPAAATPFAVGASHLGGQPDLAPGAVWPEKNGAPLAFLAQFRLEDVASSDTSGQLPKSGLLSFFYDAKQETYGADPADQGGWAVLYTPADTRLTSTAIPDAVPQDARYKACGVSFAPELTLPQDPTIDLPLLTWTPDMQKQYEAALDALASQTDGSAPRNRLLGFPDTLQDDMREEAQLASHGIKTDSPTIDPRAQSLREGMLNWVLLFQLDSDPNAGMRWADAGMLYFWIERDALQSHRFERTWVVLQSD